MHYRGTDSRKRKGKDGKTKKKAFREQGQLARKLGDLRAHIGDVPVIALTATATEAKKDEITKLLGLVNPVVVNVSPKKDNLTYYVVSGSAKVKIPDYNFR